MESEQATSVDSIRTKFKVPKFDEYLKKAGEHIGWNDVERTIKMKTIVRKPLMIRIFVLNSNTWNHLKIELLMLKSNILKPFNCVQTNKFELVRK